MVLTVMKIITRIMMICVNIKNTYGKDIDTIIMMMI